MSSTESPSTETQAGPADAPETDPIRRGRSPWIVVAVSLCLLGALVWGLSPRQPRLSPAPLNPVAPGCEKLAREFLPTNITEVPEWRTPTRRESAMDAANAAAFRALSERQKEHALLHLNTGACTCGCNLSTASCVVNEPPCEVSRQQAQETIERSKH
jgi:hypothetical protein